MVVVQFVVWF